MSTEEVIRGAFEAFLARDRETVDRLLAEDFTFSSPDDPRLDKRGYFERCWPNGDRMRALSVDTVVAAGEQAFVRYEVQRETGERFRNAEWFRVLDGRIAEEQVYYGPTL
jgi:ketosteroid isomerase-like protein